MKTKIIFAFLAVALLALSGCGGGKCPENCSDGDMCTSDSCGKETGYQCRNTPIPGCSNDCGMPCSGAAGLYMEMQCDPITKQCAADAKPGLKISTSSMTNEMLSAGSRFKIITTFPQPFNMKKDFFNAELSLVTIAPGVSNIKVKSIELTGMNTQRQTVSLGDVSVNKYIWSTETDLNEGMIIDFATSEYDGTFTNVKLRITYEYLQQYAGQAQQKTANFEITLMGVTFSWMNPQRTQQCPASCDDANEGTSDICNAGTKYFCTNQPIPGRCGNFICDPTENKCTCPADCGPCSGDAGAYVEYACASNECGAMLKPGIIQQPVSKVDERNRNFYYLQNKYTYKNPFNINKDKLAVEFKLYNQQAAVSGVKIVSVKVLDQSSELASMDIGKILNSVGSTASAEITIPDFGGYESDRQVSLRVDVEYQYTTATGTETRKDNFLAPLEKITFVNPTIA